MHLVKPSRASRRGPTKSPRAWRSATAAALGRASILAGQEIDSRRAEGGDVVGQGCRSTRKYMEMHRGRRRAPQPIRNGCAVTDGGNSKPPIKGFTEGPTFLR